MKLKKIIIFIIVFILIIGGIVLSLIIKDKEESTKYDPSYEIITNLNTTSISNKYIPYYKNFNFGKTLKSSGTFEGLFEIGDKDIYKITVNTNNLLFFYSSMSLNNSSQFYMIDNANNSLAVTFHVYSGKNDSEMISEIKGKTYKYNNWTYSRSSEYYYKFSNDSNNKSGVEVFIFDGTEKLSEESFINLSETLLNCIKIEYHGKKDSINNLKHLNMLYPVDMSNIMLSDKIKIDLLNKTTIKDFHNGDSYSMYEHIINIRSINEDYTFIFREMKNFNFEEYKNANPNLSWNTLNYKGNTFYVTSIDNKFQDMFFQVNDITYNITNWPQSGIDYKEMTKYILQNIVICNE